MTNSVEETQDFSLVLGGPLYQAFVRAHLSGTALEMLHRRILVLVLLCWLPLFVLSALNGHALAGPLPFLKDIETHVRFLIALPLLIAAELIVHLRIRAVIEGFIERRIIAPGDDPKLRAAIDSTIRLRNSVALEVIVLALAVTLGHWFWRSQIPAGSETWYTTPGTGGSQMTPPGLWFAFVSIPIFQFILLRWYVRLGLWFRLLWCVSRLKLNLRAAHPDRAGGLAFLGKSSYAFGPILFAQGALLSGLIATRVISYGHSLLEFKVEAVSLVVFFILFVLGPLAMFTPQLAAAKRRGLREYGRLASQYVEDFDAKWTGQQSAATEGLLGTGDIQSLADLGNSYGVVREMRVLPFALEDVARLAATTAVPLLPLGLTMFSPEELVMRVIQIVF